MSDDLRDPADDDPADDSADEPADLVPPEPVRTWRDHAAALAESLDLSPRRLAVGLLAVGALGLLAWRLLAPAAPAPEMGLPFAEPASTGTGSAPGGAGAGAAGGDPPAGGAQSGSAGSVAGGVGAGAGAGAPTVPPEVVVHVAGAVGAPGVQRLPGGSRVVDAVEAAGGANPDADLGRINLAVAVQDGQQVYVPRVGEAPPAPVGGAEGAAPGGAGPSGSGSGSPADQLVNVNVASADELEDLPGVGPVTAEAIISYREQNGPFTSVDQLIDVRGIGDAKLEQLRDRVAI